MKTYEDFSREFIKINKKDNLELKKANIVLSSEKFIKSHLSFLKKNWGNKAYKPYAQRLIDYQKKQKNE